MSGEHDGGLPLEKVRSFRTVVAEEGRAAGRDEIEVSKDEKVMDAVAALALNRISEMSCKAWLHLTIGSQFIITPVTFLAHSAGVIGHT